MIRRLVVSVCLIVGLLGIGVGGFRALKSMRKAPPSTTPERPALPVRAVRVIPTTVVAPVEGFGTARADRMAVVGAQVSGPIVELADGLREGASVEDGQVLIRIDPREYSALLERARGQLAADEASLEQFAVEEANLQEQIKTAEDEFNIAEREYRRVLDLYEAGTSNPRELDAARATVKRARRTLLTLQGQLQTLPHRRDRQRAVVTQQRAQVELAELNLDRCTIRAPFPGRVDTLHVEIGEQVGPGQAIVTLLDPNLMEVPLELPISQRDWVRVGAPARIILESSPESAWTGEVARVAPSADEMTRTFSLFIEVDNREQAHPLMPGMFVEAIIDGPTLRNVLLVPRSAIRRQRVFVAENGEARHRDVTIEHRLLEQAVIQGVPSDTVVITSNLDALYEGAPVDPVLGDRAPTPPPVAGRPPADDQPDTHMQAH